MQSQQGKLMQAHLKLKPNLKVQIINTGEKPNEHEFEYEKQLNLALNRLRLKGKSLSCSCNGDSEFIRPSCMNLDSALDASRISNSIQNFSFEDDIQVGIGPTNQLLLQNSPSKPRPNNI